MELEKYPETEFDYWAAIDSLGSFIATIRQGVYRGHLPTQALKEVESAGKLSQKLVAEIEEKFGILFRPEITHVEPKDGYPAPPEGKRWYWPWYHQMRKDWLASEFNKLICSACPLSGGVEKFDSEIPCTKHNGSMFELRAPYICGLITYSSWTREDLLQEIGITGGDDAVQKFLAKEKQLKAEAEQQVTQKQ